MNDLRSGVTPKVRAGRAARSPRVSRASGAPLAVAASAVIVALAAAQPAGAQKLFKYRDANGVVVYTDRQPSAGQQYETSKLERTFEKPEVRLSRRDERDGITLYAQNTYYAPVQLLYRITQPENVAANTPREGLQMLPARGETPLIEVRKSDVSAPISFDYEFQFLPGDPKAQHLPDTPYRLPYALSSSFPVSQAYPDTRTHTDPSSAYAIDFVMPIGTNVFAARGGTVIEVASDFHEIGRGHGGGRPARECRTRAARRRHDGALRPLELELDPRRSRPARRAWGISRGLGQYGLQHGAAPALRGAAQPWRRDRVAAGGVRGRGRRLDHRAGRRALHGALTIAGLGGARATSTRGAAATRAARGVST